MKFVELSRNLKTEIKKVYRLVGDDNFLLHQAVNLIKNSIVKDFEEFNYLKLDDEKLKSADLRLSLESLPMGADLKLLVLEKCDSEVAKFINTYDFEQCQTVLACINCEKVTVGEVVDCAKLDKKDISRYILNTLSKQNLSIEERALDYIIDATNGNMSRVNNELQKIIAYANGSEVINVEMVTNLVANSSEYVIYMLTNAIDEKNYVKYQTILSSMSQGLSYGEIFSYLGKYFRRMFYIAISKDDAGLENILNIKPYAIKMARNYIQSNSKNFYIDLYNKYINLDYQIKSGEISAKNAMYELVF